MFSRTLASIAVPSSLDVMVLSGDDVSNSFRVGTLATTGAFMLHRPRSNYRPLAPQPFPATDANDRNLRGTNRSMYFHPVLPYFAITNVQRVCSRHWSCFRETKNVGTTVSGSFVPLHSGLLTAGVGSKYEGSHLLHCYPARLACASQIWS